MLDDATRLEQTWHESEIGSTVDKRSIREEFLWSSPEAVRVLLFEAPHAMSALGSVGVIHVAGTADKELNLAMVVRNNMLNDI